MQQVLKLRIIGKSDIVSGSGITGTIANLPNNFGLLLRKDGTPTKMFADVLRNAIVDIQKNGGMLTLRFDWDV